MEENQNDSVPTPPLPDKEVNTEPSIPTPPEKVGDTTSSNIPNSNTASTSSDAEKINSVNTNKQSKKIIFIVVAGVIFLLLLIMGIFIFKNGFNGTKDSKFTEEVGGENVVVNGEKKVGGNCQSEYDKLLEINSFDFDKYCFSQGVRDGEYDPNAVPQKKKNLVLIFDASGSMALKVNGERKIDIAKEAAWKFIDQVAGEENFNLSIVVYGHKGSNRQSDKQLSCAGIEEMYYLGEVNAEIAKSKLNKFDATGWTPIANSFKKAKEILSGKNDDENFILLVSDGKEMCGGDPVATIKQLKQDGLNVKADVIGFDVGGADEIQLKAIAEAGDGDYFSVSNAVDLENAFAKHKEMLNKANFKIGQTVTNLYDISYIVNNYNQCRTMLEKEKIAMMLDIHIRALAGEKCESTLDETYKQRYQQIKQKIEQDYQRGRNEFEKNSIKNK